MVIMGRAFMLMLYGAFDSDANTEVID